MVPTLFLVFEDENENYDLARAPSFLNVTNPIFGYLGSVGFTIPYASFSSSSYSFSI